MWHQFGGLTMSLVLGWWSIPGLVMAPVQSVRNLICMFRGPNPEMPSEELETVVRVQMVAEIQDQASRETPEE